MQLHRPLTTNDIALLLRSSPRMVSKPRSEYHTHDLVLHVFFLCRTPVSTTKVGKDRTYPLLFTVRNEYRTSSGNLIHRHGIAEIGCFPVSYAVSIDHFIAKRSLIENGRLDHSETLATVQFGHSSIHGPWSRMLSEDDTKRHLLPTCRHRVGHRDQTAPITICQI